MNYPNWLKIEEKTEELFLNINKHAATFGRFEPVVLSDKLLENLAYKDKIVHIDGGAPVWLYAYLAYHACKNDAKSIKIFYPQENKFVQIYPVVAKENAANEFYSITEQTDNTTLTLNPQKNKNLNINDVLQCKLELPQSNGSPLLLTGEAANFHYACAAVVAAKSYFNLVLVDKPDESFLISIGMENSGNTIPKKRKKHNSGLLVGIVGDPNSGKSVLAKWLYPFIKEIIPNSWQFNADAASPTTHYFLDMSKLDAEAADDIKNKNKIIWSHELENYLATRLRTLKQHIDVTIADLPGGKHIDAKNIHERIPEGREVMMEEIDLFIILGRKDVAEEVFAGWREALRNRGLEDRVIAEIVSQDKDGNPSIKIERNDNIFRGVASGLDRNQWNIQEQSPEIWDNFRNNLGELLTFFKYWNLAAEARAATAKAFLTSPSGVRYGSAVLARNGKIYSSGQYSSFNHSTNVHAEQGSLVLATMNGNPDITALAIASSRKNETARPCGICRQVMLEHSERIGHDFDVVMVSSHGLFDVAKVSELLPYHWSAKNTAKLTLEQDIRVTEPSFDKQKKYEPLTGDIVLFGQEKYIGLVWDSHFDLNRVFVKVKYHRTKNGWVKIPHAFTQSFAYIHYLDQLGLKAPDGFDLPVILVAKDEINGICHLAISLDELPPLFGKLCIAAGIDTNQLYYTGSRPVGLQTEKSDYDIVVPATAEQIRIFRKNVKKYLLSGSIAIPANSETWKMLDKTFSGGQERIFEEDRFAETFEIDGNKISLMFVPNEPQEIVFDTEQWVCEGRRVLSGTVIEDKQVPLKRSSFTLRSDLGDNWNVIVYYKLGNLVKTGDNISLSGLALRHKKENKLHLMLFTPAVDTIVWNK
ncbi:MAG: hypothetical protein LBH59_10475 [Planctomycetaceae bacterium]|jgi:cytidine deaminase|nr:hypothetical protein [Planctomycetaceae bacterium]